MILRRAILLISCALLLGLIVTAGGREAVAEDADTSLLFATFHGNGEDGLHLVWSEDGVNWDSIQNDRSFLQPTVGANIMRDPSLTQGPDGVYHMVWTSGWWENSVGYASSTDLVNWSPQVALPVMAHEPRTEMCWAPEIRYDEQAQEYLIYWSSSLNGETATPAGQHGPRYFRTYATTTTDFQTFTPTRMFFDPQTPPPGTSGEGGQIDSSSVKIGDKYYLFYKQGYNPGGIRYASADMLQGPYEEIFPMFAQDSDTVIWEGPTAIQIGDYCVVYNDRGLDLDRPDRMGAWRSNDMVNWEDISLQMNFPPRTQHGSVLRVPNSLIEQLTYQEPVDPGPATVTTHTKLLFNGSIGGSAGNRVYNPGAGEIIPAEFKVIENENGEAVTVSGGIGTFNSGDTVADASFLTSCPTGPLANAGYIMEAVVKPTAYANADNTWGGRSYIGYADGFGFHLLGTDEDTATLEVVGLDASQTYKTSTVSSESASTQVSKDAWTHLGLVYTPGGTSAFYVNGELVGEIPAGSFPGGYVSRPLLTFNDVYAPGDPIGIGNIGGDGGWDILQGGGNCGFSGQMDGWALSSFTGTFDPLVDFVLTLPQLIPGDANWDGKVDAADAAILAANWQTIGDASWEMGDFNNDGNVDDADATLMAANWQSGVTAEASVPEPATLVYIALLLMGVLPFYRRNRR